MRCALTSLLLAPALLFSESLPAATLHVDGSNPNCPGDGSAGNPFCLIQAAIAAAAPGDTVLVAAGVYAENLSFLGKPITVVSAGGPAVTRIQAAAPGSVVTFDNGESNDAVLEGFTISGGSGTVVNWSSWTEPVGGGIFCRLSSPTIRANTIENNVGARYGAGIFCEGGAPLIEGNTIAAHQADGGAGILLRFSCAAIIDSNQILDNRADGGSGGGAILVMSESSPRIRNNTIRGNTGSWGGGIASENAAPVIHDNLIRDNLADDGKGGAISLIVSTAEIRRNQILNNGAMYGGGGIFFDDCDVTVIGNLIQMNSGGSYGGYGGGGLQGIGALAVIRGNVFEQNSTAGIGGGLFLMGNAQVAANIVRDSVGRSGIVCFDGAPEITDNLVIGNQGDGIECVGPSVSAVVRRNTIVNNDYGAVFVDMGASVSINSSILRGNGTAPGNEIFIASGYATVQWSNVQGGYAGTGNIDQDPQFTNPAAGDYTLAATSPCVDAGDPGDLDCGPGFLDEPRRLDGLLNGSRIVDMGAREFGNIRLGLTVDPVTPSITIDASGTPGLSVLLFASLGRGQLCTRYGVFLLETGPGLFLFPLGTVPNTVVVYPQPQALLIETHWQLLGQGPASTGNFSNRVTLGGS